jgi:hypothetical protein
MSDFETASKLWAAAKYQVPVDAVVSVEWELWNGAWSDVTFEEPAVICNVALSTKSAVAQEHNPFSFTPYQGPSRYVSEHRNFAELMGEILEADRQGRR